jgi:hypothetical protein
MTEKEKEGSKMIKSKKLFSHDKMTCTICFGMARGVDGWRWRIPKTAVAVAGTVKAYWVYY